MKIFMLLALACCVAAATASEECSVKKGRQLRQFAGKRYYMNMGCKYHAVRDQECGAYRITLSPTNALTEKYKYIINHLWLGVTEIDSGNYWGGRTSVQIANKYLQDLKPEPFNTKDSDGLTFAGLFDVTKGSNFVEVKAKNGDFRVKFGVYNDDDKHKASGLEFECYRDTTLNPYPDQICGNDTVKSIRNLRMKELGVKKPLEAIMYDVFANTDNIIAQPKGSCTDAQDVLRNRCEGRQLEAISACWRMMGAKQKVKCLRNNFVNVEDAFYYCVEFVCSNYNANNYCAELAQSIDMCANFPGLSNKVKEACDPNLVATGATDDTVEDEEAQVPA